MSKNSLSKNKKSTFLSNEKGNKSFTSKVSVTKIGQARRDSKSKRGS